MSLEGSPVFIEGDLKMKKIQLKAFAKINLSLDILGLMENGFHQVEMIMQQILLCDDIMIRWHEKISGGNSIKLSTNRYFLPTDNRNLAYKAAMVMIREFGQKRNGEIIIDIKKRIPVAAGLAGGSSNAAAVLHGLNIIWSLDLSLKELCILGNELGSDVPFCILGQAAANDGLKRRFFNDPLKCHCALATGTGTELKPVKGLKSHLVLSKPPISVSTAEVYKGIDSIHIPKHPDTAEMIRGLESGSIKTVKKNMINVLENFTLKSYPIVMYTKNKMQELCDPECVLMSGSGPTVFCLCSSMHRSKEICREMLKHNKESFWTRTTW